MANLMSGDASGDRDVEGQRDGGARARRFSAEARMDAADRRDAAAAGRDSAAAARDHIAELHDRELSLRDAAWIDDRPSLTGSDIVTRAAEMRRRATADRALAAEARARAAIDRENAARDREQAARDRLRAQADREALLQQLLVAETDALTGTRTRAAGLAELDHEIERARRSGSLLVIAYVDVVGLKDVTDAEGHAAGDAVLQRAVVAIRRHLRSYDLVIRLGHDEFLCVLPGATADAARRRFRDVQSTLAGASQPCEIRVGFASPVPNETSDELVGRADSDMPRRTPLT
jgi:diguanylate cyclase (GGDEF)-like protein